MTNYIFRMPKRNTNLKNKKKEKKKKGKRERKQYLRSENLL